MPDTHATPAPLTMPRIAISDIIASATNPRKRFDPASLEDLAQSIRTHDVVQPVLLRPHPLHGNASPPMYELVSGERRLRAAKLAGKENIPAMIRDLSDVDVIEIQIIENLQRSDVHPLEEAEGYERLMQQLQPGTKERYTADIIAAKVGKSRRYIFTRLKLLDLCPEGRTAFFDGQIDASKAHLLARIGHHDTQRTALKAIIKPGYDGALPSTREVARMLEREYMLALAEAPFDIKVVDYTDAKGKIIAGPCGKCPKRTGNSPDLFDDIADKDTCTDVKCHAAKREAHTMLEAGGYIAKGLRVIMGDEAKKIFPQRWSGATSDYVAADHICYADAKERKYEAIIGKAIAPIMALNPHDGQFEKLYPAAAVRELLKEKGIGKPAAERAQESIRIREAHDAEITKRHQERAIRTRGYLMLRTQLAQGVAEADIRAIIKVLIGDAIDYSDDLPLLQPIYAPGGAANPDQVIEQLQDAITAATAEQLPRILLDLIADRMIDRHEHLSEFDAMLKRYGLTPKAIQKQLDADAKIQAAAEAAAVAPTPPVTADAPVAKVGKKGKKVAA